ncbi:Functional role page for TorCAD operon transcriptional regulatory protein TorR [gamma proteobacterium IMCC2047]|nr:Functional role page for TorCAD operon transcriptional regulatory protein TorR [gamma proteobacterium IMCC2047]
MPERTYHLLIVEDEPVTRTKLVGYFKSAGYDVTAASSGEEMQRMLSRHHIDLLLLDISLPDADGLELTMELRKTFELGIILVTGRDTEIDRILGLEIGADDYVTKPFNERELLARVKSVLRRLSIQASSLPDQNSLYFTGWEINLTQRKLLKENGDKVHLTRGEFELLAALVKHPKTVMSRDRLMALVTHRSWQPDNRTIDVLIKRLREKIEVTPKAPELLLTIYGEGYVLASDVSDSPPEQSDQQENAE